MRISDWSSDVCSSDLMIGGANPAVMQSQARALRDVERENQRVAVAVARTSQKISDQSLVTARARREMSGFERSLRTTATTLNVVQGPLGPIARSEEHTSQLQSLMRISYAVFCLQKNTQEYCT